MERDPKSSDNSSAPAVSGAKRCSLCAQVGHNKRTCALGVQVNSSSSSSAAREDSPTSTSTISKTHAMRHHRDEELLAEDANSSDESIEDVPEPSIADEDSSEDGETEESSTMPFSTGEWISIPQPRPANANEIDPFEGAQVFGVDSPGSRAPRTLPRSPLDTWQLFWDNDITNAFLQQTNIYGLAIDRLGWTTLTMDELHVFFAIILYMGINRLPSRELYWRDSIFQQQFVARKMTFKRFNNILLCLHFVNSTALTVDERRQRNLKDPFWSVSPFIEKLAENSRHYYQPFRSVDIDEQCIPFKGRHIAKQYNKNKPNKWHFRVYCLNCATTGYLSNFYMYPGSNEQRPAGVSASSYPAYKLTNFEMYQNKGYILYTDNYFTSLSSLQLMMSRGIYQIGTIRANRLHGARSMVFKKNQNVERGAVRVFHNRDAGAYVVSWMDSKPVHFLTPLPTKIVPVLRRTSTGRRHAIDCPTTVCDYNKAMGGTDSFDQRMSYYWPNIRSLKWTVRVIIHFFYVSVLNSHILYKTHFAIPDNENESRFLYYCNMLIAQLTRRPANAPASPSDGSRITSAALDDIRSTETIHEPLHVQASDTAVYSTGTKKYLRRICAVCKQETSHICVQCNVGLHIGEDREHSCWSRYHRQDFT